MLHCQGLALPYYSVTGQKGAIISLVHKNAQVLVRRQYYAWQTVYLATPEQLLGNPKDTAVARVNKLGILNNIVNTVDELSNMDSDHIRRLCL